MIHGLVFIQLGDGGDDAERVGGEEDHGLGVARHAGDDAIGDIIHRIAYPGILGEAAIGEIELPGLGVHDDVLHQGAELDGFPDLGLVFVGEVDALRIAAAFHVKDAVVAPAVLVVADQAAVGVGGEGGLTGAGEAEEQGGIPIGAHVGGAVHGKHAGLGEQVVHDGEDALLDLARVLAAGDEDHPLIEVHQDGSFAMDAVHLGDALEAGGGNDGEAGDKSVQLLLGGAEQQLVHEHILAGQLVHHPDGKGILGVCAGKAIEDKDLPALEIGGHLVVNVIEFFRGNGDIDLTPVDVVMDGGHVHHKAVVRRTAGIFAGGHHQSASAGKGTFTPRHRALGELRGCKITVNRLRGDNTKGFYISLHVVSPFTIAITNRRRLQIMPKARRFSRISLYPIARGFARTGSENRKTRPRSTSHPPQNTP